MNNLLGSSSSRCQQGALQLALQLAPRHTSGKRGRPAADNGSSQWKQRGLKEIHSTDLRGRRPMFSSIHQQRIRLLAWRHLAGKGGIVATISSNSILTTCQLLMVPACTQPHCARHGSCSL